MVERENIVFNENRVDIQVISKKTYEAGIPSVEINIDTEENKERNRRKLSMIEDRYFDRDENKHLAEMRPFTMHLLILSLSPVEQLLRKRLVPLRTTKRQK